MHPQKIDLVFSSSFRMVTSFCIVSFCFIFARAHRAPFYIFDTNLTLTDPTQPDREFLMSIFLSDTLSRNP